MLEKNYLWRVYWRLAGVIMVCVVIALAVVSYSRTACSTASSSPRPSRRPRPWRLGARAHAQGHGYGVPFDELYGVEQTFGEVFEENPDSATPRSPTSTASCSSRAARNPTRRASSSAARRCSQWPRSHRDVEGLARGRQYFVTMPIASDKPLGMLHIGIDGKFVDNVLLEVMLDVVVVLVVSLFFTLELLNFMAGARLASGLGEFGQQVDRMRSGDFTATARIRANDEIGRLLRASTRPSTT
jgi:HAMP domain-containing protein